MSRGTRSYAATLAVLLAGGVLCLVASGLTVGVAQPTGRVVPPVTVTVRDALPALQAVGLLALAAVVAVHATRRTGRRLIGALLAVAGIGSAAWAAWSALDLAAAVARQAAGPDGAGGYAVQAVQPAAVALAVAGGLLVGAAGLAVVVRGPGWPGMGTRYERGGWAAERGSTSGQPHSAEQGERATWDALDRGEDPTL